MSDEDSGAGRTRAFDGTYSLPENLTADNTDKTKDRKIERESVIVPTTPFVWERDGPKVPTVEEMCLCLTCNGTGEVMTEELGLIPCTDCRPLTRGQDDPAPGTAALLDEAAADGMQWRAGPPIKTPEPDKDDLLKGVVPNQTITINKDWADQWNRPS